MVIAVYIIIVFARARAFVCVWSCEDLNYNLVQFNVLVRSIYT